MMNAGTVKAARHTIWTVYVVAGAVVLFGAGLALATEIDAITAAERIDKLGAMGVMAFGLLLSLGALVYLIRLQYGRMLDVLEKVAISNEKVAATNTAMQQSVENVKRAVEECEHNRR